MVFNVYDVVKPGTRLHGATRRGIMPPAFGIFAIEAFFIYRLARSLGRTNDAHLSRAVAAAHEQIDPSYRLACHLFSG
jgi:hypothetical protein